MTPFSWYVLPVRLARELVEGSAAEGAWWHSAGPVKSSDDLVLLRCPWHDGQWTEREQFEAQNGVVCLGDPWDPVPPETVPLLEAYRLQFASVREQKLGTVSVTVARPSVQDTSQPIDGTHTVQQALRKAVPF